MLRPYADIAANGWLPSTGTDLYAMIDEVDAADADYDRSPENPSGQLMEVRLTAGLTPLAGTRTLRYRLQAINGPTHFAIDLVENTTVVQSWTHDLNVTDGAVTFTQTVTGSVTNYGNLRLRIAAS
jgi:hypothetical protein